jgi:hypothetical protein
MKSIGDYLWGKQFHAAPYSRTERFWEWALHLWEEGQDYVHGFIIGIMMMILFMACIMTVRAL